MDIYSHNEQHYFRRNVWGWHPLADLILTLEPALASGCAEWHTNSGDGLDETDSRALGAKLRAHVENGDVARYLALVDEQRLVLPREVCELCQGTGLRTDTVGTDMKLDRFTRTTDGKVTGGCNACRDSTGLATGSRLPWALSYETSADSVLEFADFLEACDGFRIY